MEVRKMAMTRYDYTSTATDYIGLSSETENIADGSTFLEVDTSKMFVFYKGTWYEQS